EMADQKAFRGAHFAPGGAAEPDQVFRHPGIIDLDGPARNVGVGRLARRAERLKIIDHPGALLDGDVGLWPVVETRHPLPVAPQQMVEGAVDGAPESTLRLPALGVRKTRGGA